jgi:hypothetical protein
MTRRVGNWVECADCGTWDDWTLMEGNWYHPRCGRCHEMAVLPKEIAEEDAMAEDAWEGEAVQNLAAQTAARKRRDLARLQAGRRP